ncbi:LysR family transcriptional regulator [Streptomyces sp. NPDC088725]|uniref:LysR family transcriptional regulator n=1 Tax=Streptomyces sp. NPDC088725 TaxID=3365873 RepID=UPI003825C4BA
MELRQLEYFVAVAEELNFTRAGARVHVSQSSLSVAIRTLEKELGPALFHRTTHSVRLTPAGQALLTEARTVLAAVTVARDAVAGVEGGVRGTLRVGIMQSLTAIDLGGLLTRYHQERPGVELLPVSSVGGSGALARQVAEGMLDVAFVSLPAGRPKGVEVLRLAREPLVLLCPPGHRLAGRGTVPIAELAGEEFVDSPSGWGIRAGVDRTFEQAGIGRIVSVEVADVFTVAELVHAGFGLAFLPGSMLPGNRAHHVCSVDPAPQFELSLIRPDDRPVTAAAQAFIDLARATATAGGTPGSEDAEGSGTTGEEDTP